jgi:hypothetical protein
MRSQSLVMTLRPRTAPVLLCCLVCLSLASCVGLPGGTSTPSADIQAGNAQNGKSITLHTGQTLLVTLSSTYWSIQGSSDQQVLAVVGEPVVSPAPWSTCPVAGSGCGTVAQMFRAVAAGTAEVSASRVSCGEAMRCGPAAGQYRLNVAVTADAHTPQTSPSAKETWALDGFVAVAVIPWRGLRRCQS